MTLSEAGSSLLYPFLQELVSPLKAKYSNITLAPAAGGSGKGISDAIAGTVQMGGSDAYLSSAQIAANPSLLNIPIVVSSQAVNYNLPGVTQPQAVRRRPGPDLPGQDHQVERPGHRRPQPGRHAAEHGHRPGPPGRLVR